MERIYSLSFPMPLLITSMESNEGEPLKTEATKSSIRGSKEDHNCESLGYIARLCLMKSKAFDITTKCRIAHTQQMSSTLQSRN